MSLSLNEVETLAKKAARGAGYPWGLAEEAGLATRWLWGQGIDGCQEIAGLLGMCDGSDLSGWGPRPGAHWVAQYGTLCPIAAGAALSDHARLLPDETLTLENVARPMLLAPFAALAARRLQTQIALSWPETRLTTDGETLHIQGPAGAARATVTVAKAETLNNACPKLTRANPDSDTLKCLETFAHRTYAPATQASRLNGAGAGLSDND